MDWEQVRFCFLQVILIASTTEGAFQFRGFPPQLSVYLNKTFTRLNETFYLAEDNETELVQQDKISDEPYVTWKANAANLDYTLSTNILDTDTLYGTRNWTLQALQQFTLATSSSITPGPCPAGARPPSGFVAQCSTRYQTAMATRLV